MTTAIEELDLEILAGVLLHEPGCDPQIALNKAMSLEEKQAVTLQLQMMFHALPEYQRCFEFTLEIIGKITPRVCFEILGWSTSGIYFNQPDTAPRIVINKRKNKTEQVLTIARAMAFWQALTFEQAQTQFKAVLA